QPSAIHILLQNCWGIPIKVELFVKQDFNDLTRFIPLSLPLILGLILNLSSPTDTTAQETESIRVQNTQIENDYPNSLIFQVEIDSDHHLDKLEICYRIQHTISLTCAPVDFIPASKTLAKFVWDTANITVPPSSPIEFQWRIKDETGQRLNTPQELITYDDLRFPWSEIRNDELIVRWYEGNQAFGHMVYNTAKESLFQMQLQTGQPLDFPVTVLLYANEEDFQSWHSYIDDWVGGQAFPALGITTQIVSPWSDERWIRNVIPHEIAHLFFHQIASAGPQSDWPAWLDEGLAQYYEFGDPTEALERVVFAAQNNMLLPLSGLSGSFGRDHTQVQLSYDQSLSVVTYLLETWGDDGLQSLVTEMRDGKSTRIAIPNALGVTYEEFEAGWITWLGVPTQAIPATATPTLVWPTPPSGAPILAPSADQANQEGVAEATALTSLTGALLGGRCLLSSFSFLFLPALVIYIGHRSRITH
ncbi:MAG: peptidase MA family metallohydrolase, partial [Chloroflexota bacterium]